MSMIDKLKAIKEESDKKNEDMNLIHGDCLEKMKDIPDGSVDLVLCDPPYGTTACKWDAVIPLEPMWEQLKRIIKPSGAIVMTASQPFTSVLMSGNLNGFSHSWIWQKESGSNFLQAKTAPMKIHEDILMFSPTDDLGKHENLRQYFYNEKKKCGLTNKKINEMLGYATTGSGMAGHYFKKDKEQFIIPKREDYEKLQETGCFKMSYEDVCELYDSGNTTCTYNPQMRSGKKYAVKQGRGSKVYGNKDNAVTTVNSGERYPTTVLRFARDKSRIHPTQKPVALMEYLIRTYANEDETVLDFAMGSGTTGVACKNLNRKFIGIELDDEYFNTAKERIEGS